MGEGFGQAFALLGATGCEVWVVIFLFVFRCEVVVALGVADAR